LKINVDEVMEKYFDKVEVAGTTLYDCKKCREKGIKTKFASVGDAIFHLRRFHFEGGIYQYFEDIKKIYGQKTLREITSAVQ